MGACSSSRSADGQDAGDRWPQRKALLVGINYRGTPVELQGCVSDAETMRAFLLAQGWREADMLLLTEDGPLERLPTLQNIVDAMEWLVADAHSGDSLVLVYSGHGSQVPDEDGDEDDGMDETLVPLDFATAGQITDDVLFDILVRPLPKGCRLTAVMDCCHSGTILDLPYVYRAKGEAVTHLSPSYHHSHLQPRASPFGPAAASLRKHYHPPPTASVAEAGGGHPYLGGAAYHTPPPPPPPPRKARRLARGHLWRAGRKKRHAGGQVVVFSGCQDEQTSADVSVTNVTLGKSAGSGGACINVLLSQLCEDGAQQSYVHVLEGMRRRLQRRGFSQVPQLCTASAIDLDCCMSLVASGHPLLPLPKPPAHCVESGVVDPVTLAQLLRRHLLARGFLLSYPDRGRQGESDEERGEQSTASINDDINGNAYDDVDDFELRVVDEEELEYSEGYSEHNPQNRRDKVLRACVYWWRG